MLPLIVRLFFAFASDHGCRFRYMGRIGSIASRALSFHDGKITKLIQDL
jgi:hypothetical protein